ncbi:uncharacterized protein F4822DRAFT_397453 [Hypoxylon trugodes]|uniref:uncharacterized protein n=1 Tax=Hypoxylon trugodes TaxID=326681 RepID=UPI00219A41E1|nr:uncharacterized protein F4822DRAFT_397453 [Hypoxylon trugodes]KAI1391685.1 hypothetical protein F4822DRAFT_397453 [Hypoxylon trugodes]
MALSNEVRMPSFEFTPFEKAEYMNEIYTHLWRCATLLKNFGNGASASALEEAYDEADDALIIALEAEASESPPLAQCYIYRGHVLWAMKRYVEARFAYEDAMNIPTENSVDRTASEHAAGWVVHMDKKIRETKRNAGIWTAHQRNSAPKEQEVSIYKWREGERRLFNISYACPPIHEVLAGKVSCVETVQIHHLTRPQRLVEYEGDWVSEIIPRPRPARRALSSRTPSRVNSS